MTTSTSKVHVGVIGAGWWATTNHIPQLAARPDVELVSVCALGRDKLGRIQSKFGFRHATEDYEELLDQPLDAVVVSTPHHLHYRQATAALRKGLHVLCEKPMTLDAAEAWHLVHLARANSRHLLIPYGWNYKPFVKTAADMLNDGAVGTVEFALCHMASPWKSFLDPRMRVMSQWENELSAPDPATWQVKENGGGFAHGQVTHSAGLLFRLTGLRAVDVSCRMGSPNRDVDEYNAAHFTFNNGGLGVISGAANLVDDDKFQVDLRIFGSEGVLLIDMERERMEVRRHDGKHHTESIPEGLGAYSCEAPPRRFIDLIQGNGENESPGEVGAATVELIQAMFVSARQNGAVVPIKDFSDPRTTRDHFDR